MKKIFFIFIAVLSTAVSISQNVGIDVQQPGKKLSVNGSVVVDYNNLNNGTLDSASLLFGVQPASIGISSNKNPLQSDYRGLNFWTSQQKRMTILENGNIGIGTLNPLYRLSLFGNLYVDNAALFNNAIRVNDRAGIGGDWNNNYRLHVQNGNSLFNNKVYIGGETAGTEYLSVTGNGAGFAARFYNGNVGVEDGLSVGGTTNAGSLRSNSTLQVMQNAAIGGDLDPTYRLRVYDGNARIGGELLTTGNVAFGGAIDPDYRLRVYGGNARIGGDFHATGNTAIGGVVDNNYRLRVYGGNSRFGGDAEVTGLLNATNFAVANNFTIGGKDSVKSNGSSALKIHFVAKEIVLGLSPGDGGYYNIDLPDFDNVADVRLSVSHFTSNDGVVDKSSLVRTTFVSINPATNTAALVIRSQASDIILLSGTYYIMAVMKDN